MPGDSLTIEVQTLSAAGAKVALAAAEQAAAEKKLRVSIAIVDNAGNLVAFQRTDGACVTSIEAAMRKARTAVHLSAPTKVFEDLLHGGMTSLYWRSNLSVRPKGASRSFSVARRSVESAAAADRGRRTRWLQMPERLRS